ncbi:SRPBCC family protein [Arthrobacter sp. FW305-BF8]|uniref:SRPBCC family protein n=1 Tax=Arthrobacter sp. FW305-BF8 TaxID=2879617 RepID=UPI001F45701C|nr:SRPBCC family protein [Arthrobacter sp. FW305-BF8]UKA53323.1 SRPBCC family protein [Arthrobacter sp. FW305-BF8]
MSRRFSGDPGGAPNRSSNRAADLAGRGFAAVFRGLKAVRPGRPIHPRGISLVGELTLTGSAGRAAAGLPAASGVAWLDDTGTRQVRGRFSRSVGLPEDLPDILGLALRTSGASGDPGVSGARDLDAFGDSADVGDVLFASTGWGLPGRFMLVPKLDVGTAKFTTLMPYKGSNGPVLLGLRTLSLPGRATGRADTGGNFRESLATGDWTLALSYTTPAGRWVQAGVLHLRAAAPESPDTARAGTAGGDTASGDTVIRFDPLKHPLPGAGTYAWTRRLRERSYRAARRPAARIIGAPDPTGLTAANANAATRRRASADERNTMSTVTQVFNSPASAVWKVIADGWLYSGWVVGASRIRDVDARWPEVGALLHHSVGAWPLLINDSTKVTAVEPERRLELIARGWPVGEAKVVITLEDLGEQCRVTIIEDAVRGPGLAVPKALRDPVITVRNRETLNRLELMAAGGAGA